MHERVGRDLVDNIGNLSDWLTNSGLVVDRHHRDNLGFRCACSLNCIGCDNPVGIDLYNKRALPLSGFEYCGMLDRAHDDATSLMSPTNGEIVRLGPTPSENHLAPFKTGRDSKDGSRLIERLAGSTASAMRCGRIRVSLGKPREHRVKGFRAQR